METLQPSLSKIDVPLDFNFFPSTKNIYKGVVIISCVWVYKWLPCSLNFRHHSVARSNERHAAPSYKTMCVGGNRTPVAQASSRERNILTTVVNPCRSGGGLGDSHPRHHAALPQRGLKANTSSKVVSIDDRRVITTDNVRRADHEPSRRFVTRQ